MFLGRGHIASTYTHRLLIVMAFELGSGGCSTDEASPDNTRESAVVNKRRHQYCLATSGR